MNPEEDDAEVRCRGPAGDAPGSLVAPSAETMQRIAHPKLDAGLDRATSRGGQQAALGPVGGIQVVNDVSCRKAIVNTRPQGEYRNGHQRVTDARGGSGETRRLLRRQPRTDLLIVATECRMRKEVAQELDARSRDTAGRARRPVSSQASSSRAKGGSPRCRASLSCNGTHAPPRGAASPEYDYVGRRLRTLEQCALHKRMLRLTLPKRSNVRVLNARVALAAGHS